MIFKFKLTYKTHFFPCYIYQATIWEAKTYTQVKLKYLGPFFKWTIKCLSCGLHVYYSGSLGSGKKYQLQHKSTVYFATVWLSPLPKSLNFRLLIIRKLTSLQSNSQGYKIQKWQNYKNKTSSPLFLSKNAKGNTE